MLVKHKKYTLPVLNYVCVNIFIYMHIYFMYGNECYAHFQWREREKKKYIKNGSVGNPGSCETVEY